MKHLLLLLSLMATSMLCVHAADSVTSIVRDGWSYDRNDFYRTDAEMELNRKQNKGLWTPGWAEYDFEIVEAGWYELWLGGCPPEWPRDIYIDGDVVTRLQLAYGQDKLDSGPRDGVRFKEANLYLSKGSHYIRFQRYGFPGVLPSIWELRPSDQSAGARLRAVIDDSRIQAPKSKLNIRLQAGTQEHAIAYDLYWKNEKTDEVTFASQVEFSANQAFVEKSVQFVMPEAGLYSLQAKVADEWLRPADLKAGFFISGDLAKETAPLEPDFNVAGVFANGGVLQQGEPMPVWGMGFPGEEVVVTLAEQQQVTQVDAEGYWEVIFEPLRVEDAPVELRVESEGHKAVRVKDLVVGDVWLLSGQSNMGGSVLSAASEEVLEEANNPNVRLAYVFDRGVDRAGKPWTKGLFWKQAVSGGDAQNLKQWNAIPFAFGMEVGQALNYPIGLVNANRGGTMISNWISREAHRSIPSLQVLLDVEREYTEQRVPELLHINKLYGQVTKWKRESAKAEANGTAPPREPNIVASTRSRDGIALNYDSLIQPLGRLPIKGVLWYQGESDSQVAAAYSERFKVLVENWRSLFGNETLPFLYVQIAYGTGKLYTGEPVEDVGSELKSQQLKSLSEVPYTAMVVTNDLMTPADDVHYRNKLPVGQRLAWAALATVYKMGTPKLSPIYKSQQIEDGAIRLSFDHTAGSLHASGGDSLQGFTIAGRDQKWVHANAVIEGDTVLVSSPEVSDPVAVRYSWFPQPSGANLVNKHGLPAPVFRTDDWELTTEGIYWKQ
ncbi:sialate O-acetylesterase [Coraliomargarita algicola]|uniref:Sialate O-acetylesterase n=1 Tax=Coraliomargarita algicola TaxID=3092156 RepID=A0ABZ0RMW7_9BACT|nr:sialate O-acetylesterase [Coraliomargarita sp. J2-16]WPJ96751.1 sialate O-acetylesterase [Coraliomargarita sp. J2-16]